MALLGIVTAVGLGMVALVLQQEFPIVTSGPVPELPAGQGRPPGPAGDGEKPEPVLAGVQADAADPVPSSAGGDTADTAPVEPSPAEGDTGVTVADPTAGHERPDRERPSGKPRAESPVTAQVPNASPPQEPSAEVSTEPPGPTSEPEPEPVAPTHPGQGSVHGKGKGIGVGGTPPGHESSGYGPGRADE